MGCRSDSVVGVGNRITRGPDNLCIVNARLLVPAQTGRCNGIQSIASAYAAIEPSWALPPRAYVKGDISSGDLCDSTDSGIAGRSGQGRIADPSLSIQEAWNARDRHLRGRRSPARFGRVPDKSLRIGKKRRILFLLAPSARPEFSALPCPDPPGRMHGRVTRYRSRPVRKARYPFGTGRELLDISSVVRNTSRFPNKARGISDPAQVPSGAAAERCHIARRNRKSSPRWIR